jgi:hypothetical protein
MAGYFVCNNGNTASVGFFGFFELQKKNPFWGFFTPCPFFLSVFFGFWEKCQKSDFPRKRSHFRKKGLEFVTIKKNFFFPKLF